jgi:hypothetical protein
MHPVVPKANVYPMSNRDRLIWPLLAATALAAMAIGHSVELWLENLRVFGDGRSDYAHVAQSFALEIAGVLALGVIAAVIWRLFRHAAGSSGRPDFLLPALHGVVRFGFRRVLLSVVTLQIAALVLAELAEQRLSGFEGSGLPAIIGPGHATALAVHLVVGLIAAFVLYRLASFVCEQTRALVQTFATFLRWVRDQNPAVAPSRFQRERQLGSGRKPNVIALRLANRPPPLASAFVA